MVPWHIRPSDREVELYATNAIDGPLGALKQTSEGLKPDFFSHSVRYDGLRCPVEGRIVDPQYSGHSKHLHHQTQCSEILCGENVFGLAQRLFFPLNIKKNLVESSTL